MPIQEWSHRHHRAEIEAAKAAAAQTAVTEPAAEIATDTDVPEAKPAKGVTDTTAPRALGNLALPPLHMHEEPAE